MQLNKIHFVILPLSRRSPQTSSLPPQLAIWRELQRVVLDSKSAPFAKNRSHTSLLPLIQANKNGLIVFPLFIISFTRESCNKSLHISLFPPRAADFSGERTSLSSAVIVGSAPLSSKSLTMFSRSNLKYFNCRNRTRMSTSFVIFQLWKLDPYQLPGYRIFVQLNRSRTNQRSCRIKVQLH